MYSADGKVAFGKRYLIKLIPLYRGPISRHFSSRFILFFLLLTAKTIENNSIFQGVYYWKTIRFQLQAGYPRRISDGFRGLDEQRFFTGRLDAAFVYSGDNRTYFIKDAMVWRLSVNLEFAGSIDIDYPQFVARWLQIGDKITGALQWINGKTYFFSYQSYYRYDHLNHRVSFYFIIPLDIARFLFIRSMTSIRLILVRMPNGGYNVINQLLSNPFILLDGDVQQHNLYGIMEIRNFCTANDDIGFSSTCLSLTASSSHVACDKYLNLIFFLASHTRLTLLSLPLYVSFAIRRRFDRGVSKINIQSSTVIVDDDRLPVTQKMNVFLSLVRRRRRHWTVTQSSLVTLCFFSSALNLSDSGLTQRIKKYSYIWFEQFHVY